ncbi:MAG: PH domain-containing protein [Lentisphaeria bacterium]|nr:PH domain-containing protein [Lentisphaeria bacterium]
MAQSSPESEVGMDAQESTRAPGVPPQIESRVSQILTKDEQIIYMVRQRKPYLNFAPDCVVLTNRRVILYRPKLFGRVSFDDYIWRDLGDAKLKEGIWGATISLRTLGGARLSLDWLPKAPARRIYSIAQEMEEMVREERRVREMEEQRAAAGGVVIQGSVPTTGPAGDQAPSPVVPEDPTAKLTQLKTMMDAGLITQDEYETKKTEILSRL